jgi:hypothetical protein
MHTIDRSKLIHSLLSLERLYRDLDLQLRTMASALHVLSSSHIATPSDESCCARFVLYIRRAPRSGKDVGHQRWQAGSGIVVTQRRRVSEGLSPDAVVAGSTADQHTLGVSWSPLLQRQVRGVAPIPQTAPCVGLRVIMPGSGAALSMSLGLRSTSSPLLNHGLTCWHISCPIM